MYTVAFINRMCLRTLLEAESETETATTATLSEYQGITY